MNAPAIRTPFDQPPAEGEAVEIAEGVLWMRVPLPMALDHVNIFALEDGLGWTIIDTGFDSRRGRAIWERMLAGPLAGHAGCGDASPSRPYRPCGLVSGARRGIGHHPHRMALRPDAGAG